jgi:hypothetical protein
MAWLFAIYLAIAPLTNNAVVSQPPTVTVTPFSSLANCVAAAGDLVALDKGQFQIFVVCRLQ